MKKILLLHISKLVSTKWKQIKSLTNNKVIGGHISRFLLCHTTVLAGFQNWIWINISFLSRSTIWLEFGIGIWTEMELNRIGYSFEIEHMDLIVWTMKSTCRNHELPPERHLQEQIKSSRNDTNQQTPISSLNFFRLPTVGKCNIKGKKLNNWKNRG